MNAEQLFAIYYTQYRGQASIPALTTPEGQIFMINAGEAINRWASYDDTYWRELFTTLQKSSDGDKTIKLGKTIYTCPSTMKEPGGYVRILDPTTGITVRRYKIIEPNEAQFTTDSDYYCTFMGDPSNGFTMTLNPTPDTAIVGFPIEYVFYALPTVWTATSPGTILTEMSEPLFIVHRSLASRFRSTRNPYYNTAKNDGEDVLRIMQMKNNSGTWADPWALVDNTGTIFGQENSGAGY